MVYTENIEFDWDPKKAESNFRKHGVTFEEAILAFTDPYAHKFADAKHSIYEQRELLVAQTPFNMITVYYTEREPKITRIIGARKSNEKEKEKYRENRLLRYPGNY